jgi:hypothetical protein
MGTEERPKYVPRCGFPVGQLNGVHYYCGLRLGHPESEPCRAFVRAEDDYKNQRIKESESSDLPDLP